MLGERIKQARKNKGYTLVQLGDLIGISQPSLSAIESGKSIPMRKTQIALAKTLGDNFGEDWLDEYINADESPKSKKEIAQEMSVKEFLSLKFEGKNIKRSKKELEALSTLLDAEIERIEEDGY